MATFDLSTTTAGATLIAGQAFTIDKIALGTGQRTPDGSETALVTPFDPVKEDTNPSGRVDGDTLYYTYTDPNVGGGNAYDVGELGMFSGNTLVFYASRPAGDGFLFQKAENSPLLVSLQVAFDTAPNATITFANSFPQDRMASATQRGVIEIATEAEAQAGTDNERAMTPLTTKAAIGQFGVTPRFKGFDATGSTLQTGFYPTFVIGLFSGLTASDLVEMTFAERQDGQATGTVTNTGRGLFTGATFNEDNVVLTGLSTGSGRALMVFGYESLA